MKYGLDIDKLATLVELERLGTMTAVARETGYGVSAISQQLSSLERQLGVTLLEAEGRRVRLTAAGRRLADHGKTILAEVSAAERDLDEESEPHGPVRVAAYTSVLRRHILPQLAEFTRRYPLVELEMYESEPAEVDALLDANRIDLGFVYDYTLVPGEWRHPHELISSVPMVLAVPPGIEVADRISSPADLDPVRDLDWIGNSRDTRDDELAARLCALAGWAPRTRHGADSLELVVDLVLAANGTCVLPADAPETQWLRTVPLDFVTVERQMWSMVRAGSETWPAIVAVVDQVRAGA